MARFINVNDQTDLAAGEKRARRHDVFTFLWFLAALGAYVVHGFDGELTRDSSFYVYAGQEVAAGAAPYVELMNRAGPLAHLLPALGVLLANAVDIADVYGVRIVFWVIGAATVPLVYRLASAAFASRNAGHVAAAAMLCFTGYAAFATTGPQSKTPVATFIAWSLLLSVRHRWLAAGIVTGLATLTWQPVFFAAAPAALVACWFAPGEARGRARLKALLLYGLGGVLTLVATSAYFVAMGAFPEFLDGFLLANAQYTQQSGIDGQWLAAWELFTSGFTWSSWIFVVGFVLLTVFGLVALVPRQGEEARWVRASTLVLFAGLAGGSIWSYGVFNGYADAFLLLPIAALGFGALVGRLSHGWATLPSTVLAGVCAVAAVGATAWDQWRTRNDVLLTQQAATDAVFSRLPADATAITSQAPQPLALSGVRNISRYQLFTNGMDVYIDDNWPGGLAGYARWIADQDATVLTTDHNGLPDWMRPAVRKEYVYVGRGPRFFVFVHESVDRQTRAEIRDALDRLP